MTRKISIWLFVALTSISATNAQNLSVDSLQLLLRESKEDTNKVILYRMLAGILRLTDPAQGIQYGQSGTALGKALRFDKGVAGCYLNISVCYNSLGKLDSALLYIDTAIFYSHKVGDANRLALVYLNRADTYMQLQNFDQSLKDCDTSMIYAERANNDDRRARVLQTIGSVYYYQKLFDQSAEYYNKANALYLKNNNLQMSAIVLNNLSNINKQTGQYRLAVEFLLEAIDIADSLNDQSNLGMYHGSLSDVYFNIGDYPMADTHARIAMRYAQQLSNEIRVGDAWQYLGQVYLKEQRTSEGITALSNGYEIFKRLGDLNKIHTAGGLLAEAYASTGNYSRAYEFLTISSQAHDTLVMERYDADIAVMQTRFRVDEKDKEIQLLNKDKELQQQRLSRQRMLFIGSVALIVLVLIGIGLLISRYRLRNRMKVLELRHRIAADLHDEVGSSLSSIHMLSEIATQHQGGDSTQKDILARMSNNAKETMDKMSDIVWMIKPGESEGGSLRQRMERFAYEMCSNKNIEITTDLDVLESGKFTIEQRKNIYLIFKEALNNAVKYSDTERVDVQSSATDKQLRVLIRDYGKGFDTNTVKRGNGLSNMKTRAKELSGSLDIKSEEGRGTTVQLLTPL